MFVTHHCACFAVQIVQVAATSSGDEPLAIVLAPHTAGKQPIQPTAVAKPMPEDDQELVSAVPILAGTGNAHQPLITLSKPFKEPSAGTDTAVGEWDSLFFCLQRS